MFCAGYTRKCHLRMTLLFLMVFETVLAQTYKANYVGRFQVILDRSTSPWPVLRAWCAGGSIELLSVSTQFIQCETSIANVDDSATGKEMIVCQTSSCGENNQCQNEFIHDLDFVFSPDIKDGPFGEIFFECSDDNLQNVQGLFQFDDSGDGKSGDNSPLRNDNYHLVQLGILCTDVESETGRGGFDYSTNHLSCQPSVGRQANEDTDLKYTCFSGDTCSDCSVDYDNVTIMADVYRLREECITSTAGEAITFPPAPAPSPASAGSYSAEFRVRWYFKQNGNEFLSSCSFPERNVVVLTCRNGPIEYVRGLEGTVSCTKIDDETLECFDSDLENFNGRYTGAIYTCGSVSEIPETSAVWKETQGTCTTAQFSSGVGYSLNRRIDMGVYCGSVEAGGDFNLFENLFDCGIDAVTRQVSFPRVDNSALFCNVFHNSEEDIVPGQVYDVTYVAISVGTSVAWTGISQGSRCILFEPDIDAMPPTSTDAPTSSPSDETVSTDVPTVPRKSAKPTVLVSTEASEPVLVPRTMDPTMDPTMEPTMEPTMQPTMQPTMEPTIAPSMSPTHSPSINPTNQPATAVLPAIPVPAPSIHRQTETPNGVQPPSSPNGQVISQNSSGRIRVAQQSTLLQFCILVPYLLHFVMFL